MKFKTGDVVDLRGSNSRPLLFEGVANTRCSLMQAMNVKHPWALVIESFTTPRDGNYLLLLAFSGEIGYRWACDCEPLK